MGAPYPVYYHVAAFSSSVRCNGPVYESGLVLRWVFSYRESRVLRNIVNIVENDTGPRVLISANADWALCQVTAD